MTLIADTAAEETLVAPEEVASGLVRGTWYLFNPPAKADGYPAGGANVHEPVTCEFTEAWYIGFFRGKHKFQGKPINDSRLLSLPKFCQNNVTATESYRYCFFSVASVDGITKKRDPNQHA